MRTFLFTGADRAEAVRRLAMSVAGLKLPTCVVLFGPGSEDSPLASYAGILPIDLLRIRLPGLGLPRSGTPADEVATRTALAVLRSMIRTQGYRLIILDGIRLAISEGAVTVADVHSLIRDAAGQTEVAMT